MLTHKAIPVAVALCLLIVTGTAAAQTTTSMKKIPTTAMTATVPCANVKTLANCPDIGCGSNFDPSLNKLKNIRPDDPRAEVAAQRRTLKSIKELPDPKNFIKGGPRNELTALGEGTKIRVIDAYLLVAKPQGREACNCGLTDIDPENGVNTDDQLVLVSRPTIDKFKAGGGTVATKVFQQREAESITAEFTPRVRLTHPKFTRAKIQPLIRAAPQQALSVRVTGMLLFDSEHFLENHLNRVNNWEVHPILELEYCPKGTTCRPDSDSGWRSLDDL